MPQSRKSQISLKDTPYYHCISRCVRRSYLCGVDKHTGQSYEHRKQWVEDRLMLLVDIFAIDLCAFAVMSNHTHVVLHVNFKQARKWSGLEVLSRWHKLFKGTGLTQRFINPDSRKAMTAGERLVVSQSIEIYRERLYDISWFMRSLNEYIARIANQEDSCTGRFWEGRFKSQALLDEAALLARMAYVDLNPVRAGITSKPESAEHTSIFLRAKCAKQNTQPGSLWPFIGEKFRFRKIPNGISFNLLDYMTLLEETGRSIDEQRRGCIGENKSTILDRVGISESNWLILTKEFEQHFNFAVGAEHLLEGFKKRTKRKRIWGISAAKALLQLT